MLGRPQPHCPRCREPLDVSRDMWGDFYICEGCGFAEEDDLGPEVKTAAALLVEEELHTYRTWFAVERR